ncbi:hypothetical protein J6590_042040 [Homalodisca vitripennis]|nr:hypothetical protein J6590_042040 [Homalodisca vitripennis]
MREIDGKAAPSATDVEASCSVAMIGAVKAMIAARNADDRSHHERRLFGRLSEALVEQTITAAIDCVLPIKPSIDTMTAREAPRCY